MKLLPDFSTLVGAVPYVLQYVVFVACSSSSSPAAISSSTRSSTTSGVATTSTAPCAAQSYAPVVYPLRNVTLSDATIRRGVAFNVGSPPQPLAMVPEAFDNQTFLFDGSTTNCNSSLSRLECSNVLGGFFNEGASSTWSQAANLPAIGQPYLNAYDVHTGDIFGTDSVKVNPNLTLPSFPLGICRTGTSGGGGNTVGLNSNSTLTRALIKSKAIASNTWSMYFGWMGAETSQQMDGGIVFGGYDKAKIKDVNVNVTLPISNSIDQCPSGYIVQVQGMELNLANGTTASLLAPGSGSAFQACVDLSEGSNTIDYDIWQRFVNISGSTPTGRAFGPYSFYSMLVLAAGAYDGDLTITIYPNLQIKIPNHQFVTPEVVVNSQGQEYLKNITERNVLFNALLPPNDKDIPRLGRPFLSSAYLYVDYEHGQFTIWPSKTAVNQDLVAVGPPVCSSAPPPPMVSTASASASSPTTTEVPQTDSGLSKSAIAGAVVGALAGATLLCGLVLLALAKRPARYKQALQDQDDAARGGRFKRASDNSDNSTASGYPYKPEMAADRHPPQELPPVSNTRFSTTPQEMPEHSKVEAPVPETPRVEMAASPHRKSIRAEMVGSTPIDRPPTPPAKDHMF